MSESIRQSNLFAAEDYKKIFKAYAFIDYTAYDFDSLKQALINYIQTYYPEDFNDYIESSEFIAIIELLAYFGTSLAFRTDLNSRENFIDTAERRESIIRLAQMVNYVPRRNIAASGLFKISSVQTDQPLTDANGIDIGSHSVYWNDPNNPDWFDQFVQICNASFSTINPFGRPTKSGTIGSIPTDLYQLNSILRLNVTYPASITINGQQYPIDICNPDFVTNQTIFERDPDPADAFNFIYRNDSLGVASANTGFFLYFKQGNLINTDTNFDFPVPNRLFPIDIQNINQDDVYVQETDQAGTVINKWIKVPALSGENIIYNSIQFAQRNIFDVLSGANDTVTVRFADGNFGNVPTGLFRFWTRISANQALVIRPSDVQGLQISIPYVGVDQQSYTLNITFNLEQTIGNAAAAETNDQIRLRAPEVFSTQSRMVNGSDYNVLPLVYGNQITKIQALDRTYSGQSRYIDLNDPTGFHRDLIIFGEDGALFRDNQNILSQVVNDSSNSASIEIILVNTIQTMLQDPKVNNFFYDEYLPQFESKIRVNKQAPTDLGYSILDLNNPYQRHLYWKPSPLKFKNTTGYFYDSPIPPVDPSDDYWVALVNDFNPDNPDTTNTNAYEPWAFINNGAVVQFANPASIAATLNSAGVNSVIQNGIPLVVNVLNPFANVGPVELGIEEQTNYQAQKVYPAFRNTLNSTEIAEITAAIHANTSFWMYYDLLTDEWHTSSLTSSSTNQFDHPWEYATPDIDSGIPQIYSTNNWPLSAAGGLLYINMSTNSQTGTTTYDLTARGRVYVFESYRDVRFYWEPNLSIIDNSTGLALQDSIEIMPFVNTNSIINNNDPHIIDPTASFLKTKVDFNITGVYIQDDGYLDSAKVEVSLIDANGDGISDDPGGFDKIVATRDRIVFEYFTNEISGYQSTRPWVSRWKTDLQDLSYTISSISGNGAIVTVDYTGITDPDFYPGSTIIISGITKADESLSPYNGYYEVLASSGNQITFSSSVADIDAVVDNAFITTALYVYFPMINITSTSADIYGSPYIADRLLSGSDINSPGLVSGLKYVYMDDVDLLFINNILQMQYTDPQTTPYITIANQLTAFFNNTSSTTNTDIIAYYPWLDQTYKLGNQSSILTTNFTNKSYLLYSISPPGFGVYYSLQFATNIHYITGNIIENIIDKYHYDKNGKVFTQNTDITQLERLPFYFKWSHYAPIDQRVDPSATNIIDMIVITDSYYRDVTIWKNSNGSLATFPAAPTTEELRIQFQELDQYKMVSDSMIWNSGTFKLLFGTQAATELQATFKVVKAASTSISDNEVKTLVITAIDQYFDVRNWDFGEKFFYTELAAFIHQQLSRIISSVVIVPSNSSSQFGNLFEIIANPTELFISTATVNNVSIVANLTEQNLRA